MTRDEFMEVAADTASSLDGVLNVVSDDFEGIVVVITTGFEDNGEPIEHRLVYDAETGGVQ